jgi:hypothetical protein
MVENKAGKGHSDDNTATLTPALPRIGLSEQLVPRTTRSSPHSDEPIPVPALDRPLNAFQPNPNSSRLPFYPPRDQATQQQVIPHPPSFSPYLTRSVSRGDNNPKAHRHRTYLFYYSPVRDVAVPQAMSLPLSQSHTHHTAHTCCTARTLFMSVPFQSRSLGSERVSALGNYSSQQLNHTIGCPWHRVSPRPFAAG